MILSNSLKKTNIITNPRSKSRWDLINEMLELAVKNKELERENEEAVKASLIEREKSMSTGIGKGVAIPHCTTDKVNDIIIIMATCKNGIDFDSVDNLPVRIAILLLVPKNKLTQHIKTLANIAKLMNNDELREKLFNLKTPELIIQAIQGFEETSRK
jgi:PTS system fructose-specific IIA component